MTDAGFTGLGLKCSSSRKRRATEPSPISPKYFKFDRPPSSPSSSSSSTAFNSTRYQLPVFVDNDGNCSALGESRWGSNRFHGGSMVVVATGTGIGGGVISDKGDVVRGSNFCGGEL